MKADELKKLNPKERLKKLIEIEEIEKKEELQIKKIQESKEEGKKEAQRLKEEALSELLWEKEKDELREIIKKEEDSKEKKEDVLEEMLASVPAEFETKVEDVIIIYKSQSSGLSYEHGQRAGEDSLKPIRQNIDYQRPSNVLDIGYMAENFNKLRDLYYKTDNWSQDEADFYNKSKQLITLIEKHDVDLPENAQNIVDRARNYVTRLMTGKKQ